MWARCGFGGVKGPKMRCAQENHLHLSEPQVQGLEEQGLEGDPSSGGPAASRVTPELGLPGHSSAWGAVGCSGAQWGAVGRNGEQWGAMGCPGGASPGGRAAPAWLRVPAPHLPVPSPAR